MGLLIMASSRTAYAILTLGALLWVYILSALSFSLSKPILPKRGTVFISVCITSVIGSTYLLIVFLMNPFLARELSLVLTLIPVSCVGSGLLTRVETLSPEEGILKALSEAAAFGTLIFALALIREPLGLGSLSLPGGPQGLIELFHTGDRLFFPIRIIGSAGGALFILGYAYSLIRRFLPQEQEVSEERKLLSGPQNQLEYSDPVEDSSGEKPENQWRKP
jgi:Na+-transporting NADH:ubiquinone oxidoreductase subunit NqrD